MTVLQTERLRLRPFEPTDAPALYEICAAQEIAAGSESIPHPYKLEYAERYSAGMEKRDRVSRSRSARTAPSSARSR